MKTDFQGHYYSTVIASDLQRDGMGLELYRDGKLIAEVFYSDATGKFTISLFEKNLPMPVIEDYIAEAHTCLPPVQPS
ncbi:MAG TPA: hypothetical protein VMH87_13840 [Pseudomonadales bacterium]|nr:hypothetical protein [Pseudomonadales bacterium]